jgi:hypothetical protein
MLLKETWSPTRSSCFVVIFHNKEMLSLNISMVMYFDKPYIWNHRPFNHLTIMMNTSDELPWLSIMTITITMEKEEMGIVILTSISNTYYTRKCIENIHTIVNLVRYSWALSEFVTHKQNQSLGSKVLMTCSMQSRTTMECNPFVI